MSYVRIYGNLYATAITPEHHERTCNYWFTVTSGATAHTAFTTRKGLDRWLDERGLSLENDLPEAGTFGTSKVLGEYREESHGEMSEGDFYDLAPVLVTSEMSNGRYTLALITEEEGIRTVHTLNPNVKTRIEFRYEGLRGK